MIKVVIVDDSRTARLVLRKALEKSADVIVVGEVASADVALNVINRLNPDIVTMDVYLGAASGIDLTRQIMSESPRPVLVVTGINPTCPKLAYEALEVGALEVIGKLPSPSHPDYPEQHRRLLRLVRTLAGIPVVTRQPRGRISEISNPLSSIPPPGSWSVQSGSAISSVPPTATSNASQVRALVIGASTGGPPALAKLLEMLPKPLPVPVGIVQHIGEGFAAGLAKWLQDVSGHEVVLVDKPYEFRPGKIYMADGDLHARLVRPGRIVPDKNPLKYCRPCVDVLFESAAVHFGSDVIGVLLTGMGNDGTEGLRALKAVGALTLVQTPKTCVVAGMPQAALDANVVSRTGAIPQLGRLLCRAFSRNISGDQI